MQTVIVSIVLPNTKGMIPQATIVAPGGETHRVTLFDHDWQYDWSRTGRAPASLYRVMRHLGWDLPQGDRLAYESPENVGIEANEKGRVTVWEIDYDS